ncbi:juvenile hormone esterase isoform X2 [Eupeodes corollae]|nr:juvenile hormone esterase isoform X2 [Eupeodes corollae]XP_055921513.1 juvenile hormone esterase isoform X2 [Eupeodes corollae]
MVTHNKVKIKQGTVVGGEALLTNGAKYYYFKGIPYAVPPLGKLRFQAPVALESFAQPEIDCTKEGDVCSQKDPLSGEQCGSENCLFLNVYTPRRKEDDTSEKLPVMVFIHGGGYMFGYGDSNLYKPLYLMQEGVVVVTLNYRLGAFGFLSLPEANIHGNAGLKDQHLALQWVSDNISHFGGDPNNVTLFGESAGASSVHFHFLSEKSRKLFHKAILQSGTANMPWAMKKYLTNKSMLLSKAMGFHSNDQIENAKFLRNYQNLGDFWKHMFSVMSPEDRRRELPIPFGPIVEKDSPEALVTKEPLESISEENSIDIPLMMGYNSGEGLLMLSNCVKKLENFERDLSRLIPRNINLQPNDPQNEELAKKMRDFYMDGAKIEEGTLDTFQNLLSDFNFVIDAYVAAEMHSRHQHKSPLYFYRFDYTGDLGFYKRLFQFDHLKGACHGDELFYIFQSAMADEPWADRDKKMVKTMCKLWANFAKYGNPTPDGKTDLIDCTWEPVKKIKNNESFVLNAFVIDEKQQMAQNPDEERIEFWRSVYRKYNSPSTLGLSKL